MVVYAMDFCGMFSCMLLFTYDNDYLDANTYDLILVPRHLNKQIEDFLTTTNCRLSIRDLNITQLTESSSVAGFFTNTVGIKAPTYNFEYYIYPKTLSRLSYDFTINYATTSVCLGLLTSFSSFHKLLNKSVDRDWFFKKFNNLPTAVHPYARSNPTECHKYCCRTFPLGIKLPKIDDPNNYNQRYRDIDPFSIPFFINSSYILFASYDDAFKKSASVFRSTCDVGRFNLRPFTSRHGIMDNAFHSAFVRLSASIRRTFDNFIRIATTALWGFYRVIYNYICELLVAIFDYITRIIFQYHLLDAGFIGLAFVNVRPWPVAISLMVITYIILCKLNYTAV